MSPRRAAVGQDLLAGLMFAGLGALSLFLGRTYPIGTAWQMGAGYFPLILGWALVGLGILIAGAGWWRGSAPFEGWSPRPTLFVCCAFLLFAIGIEEAGFLLTAPACLLLAAAGSRTFRLQAQLILAAAATILAAGIFIFGLNLPIPLFPAF